MSASRGSGPPDENMSIRVRPPLYVGPGRPALRRHVTLPRTPVQQHQGVVRVTLGPPPAAQVLASPPTLSPPVSSLLPADTLDAAHRSETHQREERLSVKRQKRYQGFLYAKRTTTGGWLPEEGPEKQA